ncbi:hypothetical protein B0H14DRAFT_2641641 [Mycena olivaceomarginata]|nr:hypothetical protein B0H14DRAFT_2641641 [Mycena olivaceomarginata]
MKTTHWYDPKNVLNVGSQCYYQTSNHFLCTQRIRPKFDAHCVIKRARDEQLEELTDAYGAEGLADYPGFAPIEPSHIPPMFSESDPGGDIPMHSPRANVSRLMEELGQAKRTPELPADNPQQSEECSHMGSNANFPCRKCHWGGTKVEKESDVLCHACHLAGVARNAEEIRDSLEEQLRLAMLGDLKAVERHKGQTKAMKADNPRRQSADIASELKTWLDEQPGDKMNPLLDIVGLDPSQDTPVELLHTILLGVMKYIWHLLNTSQWSDTDHHLFAIRLQTTDLSGLTHFKTLMQTLALHIHSICTPEQFTLVKAAGELGALLWVPEIDNMENYLVQLKIAVANVLNAFDAVDPLRILVKIKLHLCAHIPDDVRRFGPLIRSATEIYEAYNGVFRLCSLYSNRLAPSHDISRKFASMGRVKHFLSGGMRRRSSGFKQGMESSRSSSKILSYSITWVGYLQAKSNPASSNQLQRRQSRCWNGVRQRLQPPGISRIHLYQRAVGGSVEFLQHKVATKSSQEPHPEFGWPILRRPNENEITQKHIVSFLVLPATSVQFVISVQHDCRKGDCQPTIVRKEFQEREETNRNISLLHHSDDDHFIVNISALHNSVKLRRALPRSFTELKPLRKSQRFRTKGRNKTAEKRRANAAAKKQEAELAAAAAAEAQAAAAAAEAAAAAAEVAAAAGEEPEESEEEQDPLDSDSERESDSDTSEEEPDDDEDEYLPRGAPAKKQTRKRKRQRRR